MKNIKNLTEEDEETVNYMQQNKGYFIAYKDLFSTWIEKGKDFDKLIVFYQQQLERLKTIKKSLLEKMFI